MGGLTAVFTVAGGVLGFFGASFTMNEKGLAIGVLIGAAAGFGVGSGINALVSDDEDKTSVAIQECMENMPEGKTDIVISKNAAGKPVCTYP